MCEIIFVFLDFVELPTIRLLWGGDVLEISLFCFELSKSRANPIGLEGVLLEDRSEFWRQKVEISQNPDFFQTSFHWLGKLPRGSRRGPCIAHRGFPVQNSTILWKSRFSKNSRNALGNCDFLTFPEPLDLRSRGPVGAARFSSKWLVEQVYLDRRVISEQRKTARRSNGITSDLFLVFLDFGELPTIRLLWGAET